MVKYTTVNVKLSDSQLSKLKNAVKNKQGTTLRMNARMLNENNMSTDIKLSKVLEDSNT